VITGGEGISGNLNVGGNTVISGTSAHTGNSSFGGTVTVTPFAAGGVVTNTSAGLLGTLPGTTSTVLHGNAAGAPSFGQVALGSEVSGILPVANGGTGSNTQGWVDLTTTQTAAGNKTWSGIGSFTSGTASSSTATGAVVVTGGAGISGAINVGGGATVTGTTKLASYTSGLIATDATGTLTTPRSIAGTANQLAVTNGTGVSGNPTLNIDPVYSAVLKAPFAMTGGGTISYVGGNYNWTSRYIVISNGNGTQFSSTGYFDIQVPSVGTTITGVGGASNVTVSASGIPLSSWQALYYILPIGSTNASVPANFRVVSYTSALTVPESWVLVGIVNGDDGVLRAGNGAEIQSGQTWTGGLGMAQNSGNGNYIQNGTAAQSANFNVTGTGTIGSTVKFSGYSSGLLGTDATGTLTAPRTLAVSGTGLAVTNGSGVAGNPTFNLNYGTNVATAAGGQYPVGNFGQFEPHGTYTDFNTTPNYWGWNYVQGNTNGPNTTSTQWYREITGLGSNYPARGTGSYSLELAYPRNSINAAGVWMRVNEAGTYSSWTRIDGNGNAPVSSSLHPSMDDITGWTTVLSSCVDDGAYTVNWGFNMTIDGANYTQGWISTNGVLGFGTASSSAYSNTSLPASLSTDPMLFFHWDDDGSDLIRYVVQGTAPNRNCFIQWQGSEATSCGGGASRVMAYITLSEGSNVVSVRYLAQGSNADAQGANATFGFQYAGGSSARTIPMGYNTKLLDDNNSNQHFSIDLQ
jgi:hypothetical protein